jgi:hypothetical protein
MKTIEKTVLLISLVVFALGAANSVGSSKVPEILEYKLAEFDLKDVTFVESVSQLSQQPIEDMHLGLEEVLREKVSDPAVPSPRFSLSLHGATVREILNALCNYDNRYMWTQDGRTINIYPKTSTGDGSYLLTRKLERITVNAIPDPEQGLTFLDKQLPPPREQLAYASGGGDSLYAAPWTQSFDNLTVRQFINRLSEHMGAHTSWVFSGAKQERIFTFLKGGFH